MCWCAEGDHKSFANCVCKKFKGIIAEAVEWKKLCNDVKTVK